MRNSPVIIGGARDALDALKHVLLADHEALHVHPPIEKRRQRQTPIALIIRKHLQTEHASHSAPHLRQRRGRDPRIAPIVDGQRALLDVESKARLPARETVIVPEPTAHGDPLHAEALDRGPVGPARGAQHRLVLQSDVVDVPAVPVGHDVGNAGFGGCVDELAVRVAGRGGGHRDDQELLVLECGDEGGLVGVVYWGDEDAGGEAVGAAFAGEGCDGVFFGLEEGSDDV